VPAGSKELNDLNVRLYKSAIDVPGPETARLGEAARTAGCYVVIGVCERSQTKSGSMFNTQLFFGPDGQLVGKRQKLTPTGYERMVRWGGWGDTLTAVDTPFGPLSLGMFGELKPVGGLRHRVTRSACSRDELAAALHHGRPRRTRSSGHLAAHRPALRTDVEGVRDQRPRPSTEGSTRKWRPGPTIR
jgi:hypothetical protein